MFTAHDFEWSNADLAIETSYLHLNRAAING